MIQSAATFYANIGDNSVPSISHEISTPANALVAGVWQHVALTYDKTSGLATLYINGAVATQSNFGSFTPQTSFTNLLLGARTYLGSVANPNTVYSGAMDEFSIYSRALSSNEIAAIYLAGSAGKCQNSGPLAPVITVQPTNVTVVVSNTAVFAVGAQGTALSYRWSFNHTNVLGGTNAILTLANVQATQAGNYSVVVSNPGGSVTSAVAVLTVLVPTPTPTCTPPAAGIVAWWPGQGNASDIIGGNNGTLVGAVGYTNGEVGQAFVFNGYQEMVTVGNPASLQLQDFTIESWIRRSSASVVTGPGGYGIIFGYGSAGYGLYFDQNGTPTLTKIGVSETKPTAAITDTNFHHLAVTKSGSTVIFYIDGIAYSAPAYDPGFVFTTVAAIGGRGDNLDNSFLGVIDEPSVYNRALSASEITAIYNAGSAGKCQNSGPLAPTITTQPTNLTVVVSNTAVFVVGAQGTAPLSYRWSFNHTNVLGGTNAVLTLPNVQATQAGNYSVVVSNPGGSVTSAVAVLTVLVPAPPATCTLSSAGIVGWWPGQGNGLDVVGTNNGTLVGAVGYTNGEVGQAFVFNGNQELVSVGNSPALQLQNFTIEAWLKRSSTSLVTAPGGNAIIFGYGANGYGLYFDQNGTPTLSQIGVSATQPTAAITDTSFHHLAVTKYGSTVMFYIDGVGYPAPAYNPDFVFTTAAAIGGRADNLDNSFLGVIDEVSVYSRALSSNEIAAIYTAGSAGKCQNNGPLAPVITLQPTNVTVVVSNTAVFAVGAQGTALSYRWSFNQTNLLGGTNAILTLPNVQATQAGNYSVVVSNPGGSVTSAVAVLTVLVPAPPATGTPPAAGVVGWWPGQGNANDIIGGNNGTLEGGLGFASGEVGQAFAFTGTNGDVKVPASSSLNVGATTNGLTLEAWVNCDNVAVLNPIFEWNAGDGTTYWGVHFYVGAAGPGSLYANVVDGTGHWHQISSAQGIVTNNVFEHAALTYDEVSGTATLYCNGAVVAQSNLGSFTPLTSYNLYLGRRPGPDSYITFAGLIDEPTVYNRALSANEIAAIYNAGSAGKCQNSGPLAPVITTQPTNVTVVVSNTAMFAVGAQGTAPLSYLWSFNHTNLLGGTNAILTLPNVQATQAGNYSVVVSNPGGSVTSAVAVLTVLVPAPPATCTPPPAGIVAWWPGEGNGLDVVSGFNATVPAGVTYTNAEVGQGFSFDGTKFLVVSNQPALNPTNALTVECWAYTRGRSLPQTWAGHLISKDSECGATHQYILEIGDSQVQSGAPAFWGEVALSSGQASITGSTELQSNTWYHVAMTYDGTVFKLYVNGVLDGQQTANGTILMSAEPIRIGGGSPSGCLQYNFNGLVDEPTIYNRALSANEIVAIYNAGSAGKCNTGNTTVAATAPPQPSLNLVGGGANLQLSWPIGSGTYQVEAANSPLGPWTTITLPIITNGANAVISVPPTNQQQYFRLHGQ